MVILQSMYKSLTVSYDQQQSIKVFKSIFKTSYVHREYHFTDTIECTIKISLTLSHSVLPLPIPEATTVTNFLCNLPEIFYTQRSTCMGRRLVGERVLGFTSEEC